MCDLSAGDCTLTALPVAQLRSSQLCLFVVIRATETGLHFRPEADLTGLSLANLSPKFMADITGIILKFIRV